MTVILDCCVIHGICRSAFIVGEIIGKSVGLLNLLAYGTGLPDGKYCFIQFFESTYSKSVHGLEFGSI